jgi:hypothetical protein
VVATADSVLEEVVSETVGALVELLTGHPTLARYEDLRIRTSVAEALVEVG